MIVYYGLSGRMPIRPAMAGMVQSIVVTLNTVAHQEQERLSSRLGKGEDLNPDASLDQPSLEARRMLIHEAASTKASIQAVQLMLADHSTWRMPEFKLEPASQISPGATQSTPELTWQSDDEDSLQPLSAILTWMLIHASDAPYASYRAEMESWIGDSTDVIAGQYLVITRSQEFVLGTPDEWRAKMAELDRQHQQSMIASLAPTGHGADIDHLHEVVARCREAHGRDFFIEGGCAVLAALLAQAAQLKGETGELVLVIRRNDDETWLSHACYLHHPSNRVIDIDNLERADEYWMDTITQCCLENREPEPEMDCQCIPVGLDTDIAALLYQITEDWRLTVKAAWLDENYQELASRLGLQASASTAPTPTP